MSKALDPFMKAQRRYEIRVLAVGVVVAIVSLARIYPVWVDAGSWEGSPTWPRALITALFVGLTAGYIALAKVFIGYSRRWDSLRRTMRINAHRVLDSSGICPLCGVEWPCPEVVRELEMPNAYGARKAGTEFQQSD